MQYINRHLQVLFATLGEFTRTPLSSLLGIAVIGITLALPTGLYVGLHNLKRLSQGWRSGGSLSVYLHRNVTDGPAIAHRLAQLPQVAQIRYISRAEGLKDFQQLSGLGQALKTLHHNPLPPVVLVNPTPASPAALEKLIQRLQATPGVALVQSNLVWLERLNALLRLGHRLALLLSILLGLAVILILSNTIRVAVVHRSTEIDVIRLVGGTDSFIRRPFLYRGTLQGLFGAIFAALWVEISLFFLDGPIQTVAGLYQSRYTLEGLSVRDFLVLLLMGALLGWTGARLAVGLQLRRGA